MFNHIISHRIMSMNIHNNMINSMRHYNGSVKFNSDGSNIKHKRYVKPQIKVIEGWDSEVIKWRIKDVQWYREYSTYNVTYKVCEQRNFRFPHQIDEQIYVKGFGNQKITRIDEQDNVINVYVDDTWK